MKSQPLSAESAVVETDRRLGEELLALLSVLQELTVAALELFDPKRSPDVFLDRLAERLGCYAALLFEAHPGGSVSLMSASGLSSASRRQAISVDAQALSQSQMAYELPYPELTKTGLVRWRFPVTDLHTSNANWELLLCFDGEPRSPKQLRGMTRRLVTILQTVLVHRNLLARAIENQRRLDEQKTLLECIAEVSMDGILVVDDGGRVLFHNQRFVEMWALEDVIESGSNEMLLGVAATRVEDPEAFLAGVRHLFENQELECHDETRLRDGRVFDRYCAPVRGAGGLYYGRGVYFRDITDRTRAAAERERLLVNEQTARVAAEEAIHARDEFLSIASHELRTPLTSMQLVVELALLTARKGRSVESGPSRVEQSLETVERQSTRLNKLVDTLLDVSRIQAGRLKLELESTDLLAVTHEVLERFASELQRSGSRLSIHGEAPVIGMWDRSRSDQIVTNLISNAIKYGRGNPIEVTVEEKGAHAHLVVRDQGLGIPKERMPHIFSRFERAVSSQQYGGLGLGLYIVRQLVEMHGGSVHVESELGVGSTFTVELPLEPSASVAPEPSSP
jgi:signal transduction histidine kinase